MLISVNKGEESVQRTTQLLIREVMSLADAKEEMEATSALLCSVVGENPDPVLNKLIVAGSSRPDFYKKGKLH